MTREHQVQDIVQTHWIAGNASVNCFVVVGPVVDEKSNTFGINAQTKVYGDMLAIGIIDPMEVVRTALQAAASIAVLIIHH